MEGPWRQANILSYQDVTDIRRKDHYSSEPKGG